MILLKRNPCDRTLDYERSVTDTCGDVVRVVVPLPAEQLGVRQHVLQPAVVGYAEG